MSNDFNYNRTIRGLKNNARKSNFYSALQLAEYYETGKFVDKSESQAKYYEHLAYRIFQEQDLHIKSCMLENYRGFKKLDFVNFHRNVNIFIGNNGAGKTSILDALDLSLGWLRSGINKSSGGSYLEEDDINIYAETPVSCVFSEIHFNKNIVSKISLTKSKNGYERPKNSVSDIKKVSNFYKTVNTIDENTNLPLLAYYNVMRSYDVTRKDIKHYENISEITIMDKFDAYQNSLTGKTDFNSFFKWFKSLDDKITAHSMATSNTNNTLERLGIDKSFLEKLKEIDISAYQKIQEKITSNSHKSGSEVIDAKTITSLNKQKKIVNHVVSKFMRGYSDISVKIEPQLDLTIKKNEKNISILKLSQGEKTLLALVLDIARRMMLLNPSLENPLEGNGVILIDEFDLHLHPNWQKDLANNLESTFPNCQFFLTTHSPLALSELSHDKVFILEEDSEGEICLIRPKQCFGLNISQIVDSLMTPKDIEQLGQSQEVLNKYDEIFDLIDDETLASLTKASNEIDKLIKLLNGNTPELIKAKVRLETALAWHEDD